MKTTVWIENSTLTSSYSVRWYDPITGKKASRKEGFCATYKEAQKLETKKKSWLQNYKQGRGDQDAQVSEIFEHYIHWCIKQKYSPATIQSKRDNLKVFVSEIRPIKGITSEVLHDWKLLMERQSFSPSTVYTRLTYCKAFLNWCVRERYFSVSPFDIPIIVPETDRRKIPAEEIALIESKLDNRLKAYFYLIADHGTRLTETLLARWEDFDLEARVWHISGETTKRRRGRTIPLSSRAVEALKSCLEPSGLVFKGFCKTTPRWYLKKAKKAVEKDLGIKLGKITPHLFRHTRASQWRGNVYALMDYMGWKSMAMGKRYSHFNVEELREESKK